MKEKDWAVKLGGNMSTQAKIQEVMTRQNPERQSSMVGFRKILVAVDYLASTSEVFEQAMQLAQAYGSQLMIFHTIQEETPGIPEIDTFISISPYGGVYFKDMIELKQQLIEEAREKLLAWLRSFGEQATKRGIPTEFDYKIGEPGRQICELAKSWGADLIAIGRRGRKGLSEIVLGSVSNYVVHHAPCSVLVIQH